MKIQLTVTYTDGETQDVEAVFADFVAFERVWSRSVARFEQEIRLTDLAWLAWSAETRAGRTFKKFDPEWIATVEDVATTGIEEGGSPLETTQPTG
ncbi:hypothetical protein UFOVP1566_10 [uncultured Caudovirales phage]|uniref:Uncharacterized protein n=1 Tax=uncultured Caudovirales phage TaxID=2100421 RepID=A0A6J5S6G6_9CAUD|nr:hypothetical protein UFOVP1389_28 [uncultured Caudovirales phage]CAB5229656.1 hypothetical protein UFOVP1566_10 [uncultured Caudovirales phage]